MRWVFFLAALFVGWLLWFSLVEDSSRASRAPLSGGGADRAPRVRTDPAEGVPVDQAAEPVAADPGIDVTITVVDEKGRSVAGVRVDVFRSKKKRGAAVTDENGAAHFPGRRESYLVAFVDKAVAKLIHPRREPNPKMTLPTMHAVYLRVLCDGVARLPGGLEVSGLIARSNNPEAGEVHGMTIRTPMVATANRPKSVTLQCTAPGYWPASASVSGNPLSGTVRLNRGVEVILKLDSKITAPKLRNDRGKMFTATSRFAQDGYYRYRVRPGHYEVVSAFLETPLGAFVVPDQFKPLTATIDPPTITKIRIHQPRGTTRGGGTAMVEIDGKQTFIPHQTRHVVLDPARTIRFTAHHAFLIPHKDLGSVEVRGVVEEVNLTLVEGIKLQFRSELPHASGTIRLYHSGQHKIHAASSLYMSQGAPGSNTFAAGIEQVGRFDVWIDPGIAAPVFLRDVNLTEAGLDLGNLEFERGTTVFVPGWRGELHSVSAPFLKRRSSGKITFKGGTRYTMYMGCPPGRYTLGALPNAIEIDVPDAETYYVER